MDITGVENEQLNLERKILTIIPARELSKRVPNKNIKALGDKPLIQWTIEVAKSANLSTILVSTDSEIIAKEAKFLGVKVPYMRAPNLATDTASVIDVVLEALEFYKKQGEVFDGVLLLQPTSPFRTSASIERALSIFNAGKGESVVSVSHAKTHPYWCKRIVEGRLIPFDGTYDLYPQRSQDLPEVYELNGLVYLASVDVILTNKDFYSENTQALVIDSEEEALDIDTEFDWLIAESIVQKRLAL
jgi:CMP-N,N'-diacetyllegionaminic acid synthase